MTKKEAIEYIQRLLNKYGTQRVVVDGYAGDVTEMALDTALDIKPKTEHFSYEEFKCNDGSYPPKRYWDDLQLLMYKLEHLRSLLGDRAITINSGYRSRKYNRKINGAKKSRHMYAEAADIDVEGMSANKVYEAANQIFKRGGVGKYKNFTHVDNRGYHARW